MTFAESKATQVTTRHAALQPGWLALIVLVHTFAWVFIAARSHTALHHDMAEQFIWAHAWQLGYPKHPPLPTWLFGALLTFLPPVPFTLYALSALCFSAAGIFTGLIAREVLGRAYVPHVLMLWALQQPFSWRAWIYNHNTVLVMVVAFTAWCAARAVRKGAMAWWVAAGIGAALCMLTKLQAAIPLAGIAWALWRGGALRSPTARKGIGMALLLATLLSAPALGWMLTGHTNALTYATHQFGGNTEPDQMRYLQFFITELRMMAPTLVVLLAWICWSRGSVGARPTGNDGMAVHARYWVEGLAIWPLLAVLLTGALGGTKLHGQWGVQTFQFLALALVFWFEPFYSRLSLRRAVLVMGLVQGVSFIVAASPTSGHLHAPGAVSGYPARVLAEQVLQDWHRYSNCPLRYVSAPFFEGGQMAAYLPGYPIVLEDDQPAKNPAVDIRDMARHGAVVMARDPASLPTDVRRTPSMALTPPPGVRGVYPVAWGVRLPQMTCPQNGVDPP